jgi:AcrR family transcriptional regulator
MPRITAPTVAEHRARQHAALMKAAREILLAGGPAAVTPTAVGARAGLARSSVYKYFSATADILAELVEDIFTVWTERVRRATAAEPDPAARVAVYVRTYLEFAQSNDRRIGYAASAGLPPERLEHVMELHRRFNAPLLQALADRGDPDPEVTTELITGTLEGAIRLIDADRPPEQVIAATLSFLSAHKTPRALS